MRSPEELADSPEFHKQLQNEFSVAQNHHGIPEVSRRDFLRLLGGTFALAGISGLGGCVRQPRQKIVPYIDQPERVLPGKALRYATTFEFAGFGRGVVVATHEGRPTKVEGNVLHPASLGATTLFEQATLLDLYNPTRSSSVVKEGEANTWPAFLGELQAALSKLPTGGAGLHLLTGTITSPTFGDQWNTLLTRYPAAQWHQYEPLNHDAEHEGSHQAFGNFFQSQSHFEKARIIVSLAADFLFAMPGSVRYARDFISGRNTQDASGGMNRLYVLESAPTLTGASADDRRPLSSRAILEHGTALAQALGVAVSFPTVPGKAAQTWAATVAADLKSANGPTLIIAGASMPPEMQALAHTMNSALGNIGTSVTYTAPVEVTPVNQTQSLKILADAIHRGQVQVLLLLGGDWAHTAPADFGMEALIRQVPLSIHLGMFRNRTANAARWHIPQAHPFEAWSDTRAFDGTTSIVQPLIEPLFGGRTAHELIDCLAQFPGRHSHEIIRDYWRKAGVDDKGWNRALHDGLLANTAAKEQYPTLKPALEIIIPTGQKTHPYELIFTPDYGLWDGRFSENAWLQELPRPISQLSWENALLVSPATATRADLATGDVVEVTAQDGRKIRGAVLVQPGVAEDIYALSLGCGAFPETGLWFKKVTPEGDPVQFDKTAQNAGIDGYPIRTSDAPWQREITLRKAGERHVPVTTQPHHQVNSPDLIRIKSLGALSTLTPKEQAPKGFYNLTRKMTDGIAWGMVIDLTRCIGCNACVAACQAENNIPPVGRREVEHGREMHWIRIDSYHFGNPDQPMIAFQPVPCMHCETAPCELVCPVGATLHDHEGLNVQVYNRCIGTRYCSNNCPYKVRRFNFLHYAKPESKEPLLLSQNPNVTVRTRGVMEKCTYCVQRITAGRINAEVENRKLHDGEVIPACAQACPTQAIQFGDLSAKSRVAALKQSPLDYSLLTELNTHPRTSYLMRITNPNSGTAQHHE